MVNFEGALGLALKTGKFSVGPRQAIDMTKTGRAKLVIIASNCPDAVKKEIQYYSQLSGVPVYLASNTSQDLRRLCAKPYNISTITIKDPGESEILRLVDKPDVK